MAIRFGSRFPCACFLVLGLTLSFSGFAAADPASGDDAPVSIIFILDASGSMWGQIDGITKIEIAKQVMTELILELPEHAETGLVAYGHRRKGDCEDVEELVSLQPKNTSLLTEQINAIKPKGMTPITLAVKTTAETLRAVENETIIILVSDGKETCEGDPCALVRELREAGIKFTMHVIGFDVTEEERLQLECMARAGGGQYFTAKTAQELEVAARQAVVAVEQTPATGNLRVTVIKNGEPSFAWVRAYEAGTENEVETGDTSAENPETLELPPGNYDIVVTDDRVRPPQQVSYSDINIAVGETVEKTADFSQGHLSIEVLVNDEKDGAGLYVFHADTKDRVVTSDTSRDNPKIFDLVPGVYDLEVTYRKSKPESQLSFTGIEIQPGQTVEKKAEFGFGELSIEVLVNGDKGSAGLYVFQAGTDNRVTTSDTSSDNPKVFNLNAGAYDLKVAYRKAIPETEVILENLQVVKQQVVAERVEFKEGYLEVQTTSGGQTVKADLKFFRPGEQNRFATGNAAKTIHIQPGDYEVVVRAYGLPGKPEKRLPVSIQAGQTVTLDVEF